MPSNKKVPKKHTVARDYSMHPDLRKDISEVRGSMVEAAHEQEIPTRFVCTPDESSPQYWIKDTETGRETCVGLFTYREVREVLSNLFGESQIKDNETEC